MESRANGSLARYLDCYVKYGWLGHREQDAAQLDARSLQPQCYKDHSCFDNNCYIFCVLRRDCSLASVEDMLQPFHVAKRRSKSSSSDSSSSSMATQNIRSTSGGSFPEMPHAAGMMSLGKPYTREKLIPSLRKG